MYNRSDNWQNELRRSFLSGSTPATFTIVGLCVVCWLWMSIAPNVAVAHAIGFDSGWWPLPYFWTLFTWPFLEEASPFFILLWLLWFFNVGSSLERSWGTRRYVGFFLATNALTAFSLFTGHLLLHLPVEASGIFFGSATVTVAWCLLNRRETICFGMILPIPAIWIAYLTMAMVWWYDRPLLGLFALAGCAAAWWYVQKDRASSLAPANYKFRLSDLSPPRKPESDRRGGFSWSRYKKDREERRRLEAMFRRSGFDDKDGR